MELAKKILKRVFFPPLPLTVFIAVPAFAAVFYVLAKEIGGPPAYLSYLASAYALTILVLGLPGAVRSARRWTDCHPLAKKIRSIPLSRRYVEDITFRTEVSLGVGFAVNLLYIAMKLVSGIYYRSAWLIALAVYYTLLAVMRFLLLCRKRWPEGRARQELELRRYRLCGCVLLLMNLALSGIVVFMVRYDRGYQYPGTLIYAMAAYSFYAVISAAVNVIKFRRYESPILSAAKAISLVAALVSILSLETAMLAQFGSGDDPLFRKAMTGATGGGVCVMVLGTALFMIVKASRQLRQSTTQNT
nr:hypothetical protein [uncultured Oscillibacter sp.]